jgi:hypothetical protein
MAATNCASSSTGTGTASAGIRDSKLDRLADTGRRTEGLTAIQDAVEVYVRLGSPCKPGLQN